MALPTSKAKQQSVTIIAQTCFPFTDFSQTLQIQFNCLFSLIKSSKRKFKPNVSFHWFSQTLQIQSKGTLSLIQSHNANSIQMFQSTSQHNLKSTVELNLSEEPRLKTLIPDQISKKRSPDQSWAKINQNPKQTVWTVLEPWKTNENPNSVWLTRNVCLTDSWASLKNQETPEAVISCG